MNSRWFVSRVLVSVFGIGGLLLGSAALPASAETPFLLKDLNTRPNSAAPADIFAGTNLIFFTGFDLEHGFELWVSDGTSAGTRFLKDLEPGPDSSFPNGFAAATVGGTQIVFFAARTAAGGNELWRSDGTVSGTFEIDINPGAESSFPGSIVPFGQTVLFHASSPNGRELWRSSGTVQSTQEVINLGPGAADGVSNNAEITLMPDGTMVLFPANDGTNGVELFRTQGTSVTTVLVANLSPGGLSSDPQTFVPVPALGRVAFSAFGSGGSSGAGVFTSDGITITPLPIANAGPNFFRSIPTDLALIGASTVLFVGERDTEGRELWRTDAALTQVFRVADLAPGPDSFFTNFSGLRRIKSANGRGFFQNETPFQNPEPGVFSTDGFSIFTVSDSEPNFRTNSPTSLPFSGRLYFRAFTEAVGDELFSSDGTPQGTRLEADIFPGLLSGAPDQLVFFKGDLYFVATTSAAESLFRTTAAGSTVEVASLAVAGTKDSGAGFVSPVSAGLAGNKMLFTARDSDRGIELFVTDGTAAGSGLLADISAGLDDSFPTGYTPLGNGSFFTANTLAQGTEPWFSDGTAAGTRSLGDIRPGRESSVGAQRERANVGGKILFLANDGSRGDELWATDGTPAGTQIVKDINLGAGNGIRDDNNDNEFGVANGILFFSGNDTGSTSVFDFELWRSDGTAAGTFRVKDIRPPANQSGNPRNFAALKNTGEIFFTATTQLEGEELWKSDGTESGTVLVKDINPGAGSAFAREFRGLDSVVLFVANTTAEGQELWRTDGTGSGTQLLLDINPGPGSSQVFPVAVFPDRMFFVANDGAQGSEVWVTDGTAAGTIMLGDFSPGPASSFAQSVIQIEDDFYIAIFSLDGNGTSQSKLFKSDGTPAGTVEVPVTGSAKFSFGSMAFFRGLLLFGGADPLLGFEPFALLFDACPDDQAKKSPGACGCGIVDSDANANGVTDCLSNAELLARLQSLKTLLQQLKLPKNARQLKNTKKKIKAIKAQRKDAVGFANASAGTLTVQSGVNLSKLLKKINQSATQAFKLSSRTFKTDRKQAIKAVGAVIAAID